jgi:hypothetical protein
LESQWDNGQAGIKRKNKINFEQTNDLSKRIEELAIFLFENIFASFLSQKWSVHQTSFIIFCE